MGTRSRIGVMHGDNCKSVYCHWDGYLGYVGRILLEHYDSAKANHLVALGDLSSLRPEIGSEHPFSYIGEMDSAEYDKLYGDMCTFYGRDRGELSVSARRFKDFEDYKANHQYEEYEYILRQVDGKAVWFVADHCDRYIELEVAMAVEAA